MPELIPWNDRFSTGSLNELAAYTDYHFKAEETILEKTHCPAVAAHKLEHKEFVDWLTKTKARFTEGKQKREFLNEVINYLKGWLTSHIVNRDKKNSYYLCKSV